MQEDTKKTGMVIGGVAVLVIAAIIGLVAFNNSNDDTSSNNSTSTSQSSEDNQSEEQASSNIVELAQASPDLSTLVDAVVAAELVDTLSDKNAEYTVFAPTNAAFEALPEGTLEDLLKPENQSDLANILTFHVVPSVALSSYLSDGQKIKTVQGDELTVDITDGVVSINDAKVVTADVQASNGVVHIIDAVLLPN